MKKIGISCTYRLFFMEENFVKQESVMDWNVKFVLLVILVEKDQSKQRRLDLSQKKLH